MNRANAVIAIVICVACTSPAHGARPRVIRRQTQAVTKPKAAAEQKVDEAYAARDRLVAALTARREKIEAELATLDRSQLDADDWAKEWAGTYYTGDGLGMNVRISVAPKSGIVYTWYGCLGLYDSNESESLEPTADGLKVKWATDPAAGEFKFVSNRLYFVRWGDRRYLVPEAQMRNLIDNYNSGGARREGMHGIPELRGDALRPPQRDAAPPAGRPQLPPQFDKLIVDKPVRLKMLSIKITGNQKSVGELRDVVAEVEFNGGSDQGLWAGMRIDCDADDLLGTVLLTKVDQETSSGKLHATLFNKSARLPEPDYELVLPGAAPDTQELR